MILLPDPVFVILTFSKLTLRPQKFLCVSFGCKHSSCYGEGCGEGIAGCVCPRLCLEVSVLVLSSIPFFVLVLTLKVWKVLWRVRWTNQSPGAGPSRTCTEGTTCPHLWATVCPVLEDILHFGKCLNQMLGRDRIVSPLLILSGHPCVFPTWPFLFQ